MGTGHTGSQSCCWHGELLLSLAWGQDPWAGRAGAGMLLLHGDRAQGQEEPLLPPLLLLLAWGGAVASAANMGGE